MANSGMVDHDCEKVEPGAFFEDVEERGCEDCINGPALLASRAYWGL